MLTGMPVPRRACLLSRRLYVDDGLHNPVYAFANRNTMPDYSLPILTPAMQKAHITLQQTFNSSTLLSSQKPDAHASSSRGTPDFARGYKDDPLNNRPRKPHYRRLVKVGFLSLHFYEYHDPQNVRQKTIYHPPRLLPGKLHNRVTNLENRRAGLELFKKKHTKARLIRSWADLPPLAYKSRLRRIATDILRSHLRVSPITSPKKPAIPGRRSDKKMEVTLPPLGSNHHFRLVYDTMSLPLRSPIAISQRPITGLGSDECGEYEALRLPKSYRMAPRMAYRTLHHHYGCLEKGFVDTFHVLRNIRPPASVYSDLLERALELEQEMWLESLREVQYLQEEAERLEAEQNRLQSLGLMQEMMKVKRELQNIDRRLIEFGILPELLEKIPDEEPYVEPEPPREIAKYEDGECVLPKKHKDELSGVTNIRPSPNWFEKYRFRTPKGKGTSYDWPQGGTTEQPHYATTVRADELTHNTLVSRDWECVVPETSRQNKYTKKTECEQAAEVAGKGLLFEEAMPELKNINSPCQYAAADVKARFTVYDWNSRGEDDKEKLGELCKVAERKYAVHEWKEAWYAQQYDCGSADCPGSNSTLLIESKEMASCSQVVDLETMSLENVDIVEWRREAIPASKSSDIATAQITENLHSRIARFDAHKLASLKEENREFTKRKKETEEKKTHKREVAQRERMEKRETDESLIKEPQVLPVIWDLGSVNGKKNKLLRSIEEQEMVNAVDLPQEDERQAEIIPAKSATQGLAGLDFCLWPTLQKERIFNDRRQISTDYHIAANRGKISCAILQREASQDDPPAQPKRLISVAAGLEDLFEWTAASNLFKPAIHIDFQDTAWQSYGLITLTAQAICRFQGLCIRADERKQLYYLITNWIVIPSKSIPEGELGFVLEGSEHVTISELNEVSNMDDARRGGLLCSTVAKRKPRKLTITVKMDPRIYDINQIQYHARNMNLRPVGQPRLPYGGTDLRQIKIFIQKHREHFGYKTGPANHIDMYGRACHEEWDSDGEFRRHVPELEEMGYYCTLRDRIMEPLGFHHRFQPLRIDAGTTCYGGKGRQTVDLVEISSASKRYWTEFLARNSARGASSLTQLRRANVCFAL